MTPRLIVFLLLLVGAVLGVVRVLDWRADAHELHELKPKYAAEVACGEGSSCERKRLAAAADALAEAQTMFAEQVRMDEETDRAMQARLHEADRRYLDAADRLARIRVCPATAQVPGHPSATVAGEPGAPTAEYPRDGASLAGLGPILRDGELDAGQVAEFQRWYAWLRASREPADGRK